MYVFKCSLATRSLSAMLFILSFFYIQPPGGNLKVVFLVWHQLTPWLIQECVLPFYDMWLTTYCVQSQNESVVGRAAEEYSRRDRWIDKEVQVNNSFNTTLLWHITTQGVNRQTSCQPGIIVGGYTVAAAPDCPLLSQSFRSIMALSMAASKPLFKYLWKQLTEQCQRSSRWLMKGQDRASRTIEPQRASWTWHRWTGQVKDGKEDEWNCP